MTVAPTPRAIVTAFSSVLLYILGFLGIYPYITLPVALILVVILVADYASVQRYESLLTHVRVTREPRERAAPEGTQITVMSRICNDSEDNIRNLIVVEELPPRTRQVPRVQGFLASVKARGCISYTYGLVGAPGLSTARSVILVKPSLLAMFESTRTIESIIVVRFYPATTPVRARTYSGEVLGLEELYSRRIKGVGMEFYSIREYQPGDDPRRIVWSASARLGRLMVREDLAELRLRLYLFVDLSRPMWIGAPGYTPGDNALRVASSIAMGVKQSAGILGYTFLHGEVWFSRPPTHASQSFFELYNRASLTDPYISTPRTNFRDALREASSYSETIPLIVITGPEISLHIDDVLEIASKRRAPLLLLYLVPSVEQEVFLREYEYLREKLQQHPLVYVMQSQSFANALEALRIIASKVTRYAV